MTRKKPTKEQLAEAKKPIEPGYMAIKMPYKTVLVPHKEGVTIMQALASAELIEGVSYGDPSITQIAQDKSVETTLVSREMYLDIKMAELLNMKYKEYILKDEELPF